LWIYFHLIFLFNDCVSIGSVCFIVMIGLVCYWKTHLQDKQLKPHPQKNTESEILREHIRKEREAAKAENGRII
jgi:hypothetical protein